MDPVATEHQYDVFLSHNSADKPGVEVLAARLEDEEGLKAFLDKWHLVPGEPWQEALEEALGSSASCAVFLGPGGLGSWENEELRSALEERVRNRSFRVIPVLLPGANPKDPATLPPFLRRTTWVDFRSGLEDPEAFRRLVAGIRGEAPGRGSIAAITTKPPKPAIARWLAPILEHVYSLAFLILPTTLLAAAVWILMIWRVPTRVQVDIKVDRAVLTVGGTDPTPVLDSLRFRSITIEKFASIELAPEKVEAADPASYVIKKDQYPESAWKPLQATSQIVITGEDEKLDPTVTLESTTAEPGNMGTLDRISARPGSEVTFGITGSRTASLAVRVEGQGSSAFLSIRDPFRLMTTYCRLQGLAVLPFKDDSLTFRVHPSDPSPQIVVTGRPHSVVITMALSAAGLASLLPRAGIPVIAVNFTRQDENGNPLTSLVSEGEITYPQYPKLERVSFKPPDFIGLDRLKEFHIENMALDPENQSIRLRLHGVAGHVSTGSQEFPRDCRLTRFEALRQNSGWMILLSIIVWALPTTAGAHKLYREYKGKGE